MLALCGASAGYEMAHPMAAAMYPREHIPAKSCVYPSMSRSLSLPDQLGCFGVSGQMVSFLARCGSRSLDMEGETGLKVHLNVIITLFVATY